MNPDQLALQNLAQFFAMPFEQRKNYLANADSNAVYILDQSGSQESNPLKYLTVSFQGLIHEKLNAWQLEEPTLLSELNALLSMFIYSPQSQDYVWIFTVDPKTYGVAGELWPIVERLSRLLCNDRGWALEPPRQSIRELAHTLSLLR